MIGKTISHYKILEKLGGGGMGEVYLAEDTKLKREVALKFLPKAFSKDPDAKKRFMEEARSSSHLDHANICVIHDIKETEDGQLYIVMNYCKGNTLADLIKEKDLTVKQIVKYITQIAKGIEKAHSKGIIHCDIKPTNIIITEDDIAKIVDFGIAKIASEEKLISKDRTSGTIAYMSPEQVSNANIDARSDLWSLGVVFYEMLTKQLPFQDSYNEALMYSIINEEPKSISEQNPDVPPELEKIILKMLEKDPDVRYHNISGFRSELKSYKRSKGLSPLQLKVINAFSKTNIKIYYYVLPLILIVAITLSFLFINKTYSSPIPSIAIMNMENLGQPNDDFWSRGLTEDLIVSVASAGIIRVPTINEINNYTKSDFSIAELAEKLRVDYLLSSSFVKSDTTFDLWCRIIDPKTGKDIFAKKWSKSLESASTITTLLAGTILNTLGISSDKSISVPVIVDPDAYELYLKGKHAWETRQNNNDINFARDLLNKAIDIDPKFILAKIQLGKSFIPTGEYEEALSIYQDCIEIGQELDKEKEVALAMYNIGNIHLIKYELKSANEMYKKALKIIQKYDDKNSEANLLRNMGSISYYQNNFTDAAELYNESKIICEMIDDKLGEGESLNNLGSVFLETMNYDEAMTSFLEAYNIFKSINYKSQMGFALMGLSYCYNAKGDMKSAIKYANQSLESSIEITDKQNELNSLAYLGEINYCIGNYDESLILFKKASELAFDINDIYYNGISNQFLGLVLYNQQNFVKASNYFKIADSNWKIMNSPEYEVWTYTSWALCALNIGDFILAEEKLQNAEQLLEETKPYADYAPCVYNNIYKYYDTIGDSSKMIKYLSNAFSEVQNRLEFIDRKKDRTNFINQNIEFQEIINQYNKFN
jgi:serine/threonine protein kinase/tetratricopeptide (TPR) repeat protein